MQCNTCDHIWTATPISKIHNHTRYGTNGCPQCYQTRRDIVYGEKKKAFLAKLESKPHIEILSEYDGTQNFQGAENKVHFRNTICDHDFWSYPNYILNGKSEYDCPVCGLNDRTDKMSERNLSNRFYDDPTVWKEYRYLVASHTRRSYIDFKHIINPDDLPIGLNGTDGAYQVDHIVSKAIGFQLGIPPELLSHHTNLQMLPWEENLAHKDKFKGEVPDALKEYFSS